MYYLVILASVFMFGGCFAMKDQYRKRRGSGLMVSMEAASIGGVAGLVVLLAVNGFTFEFSLFTLFVAGLKAINGILFSFCSFKALDRINLSLFSLYSMLGGMLLPFLQGVIFYNEPITVSKIVCVVFVSLALICTVKRGEKKKGRIYYIGIFVLNGMSGVLSKIYTGAEIPKTSAAAYSAWCSVVTILLSLLVLLVLRLRNKEEKPRMDLDELKAERKKRIESYGIVSLSGSVNTVANFLLVMALLHVDSSVQYPMVTGGTMIVSTLISCFGKSKPNKMEITSVALAFLGMLALFLIPV